VDGGGHADATGIGQPFEARRNIHSITENVIALHHDIAEVHAYAKLEPPSFGQLSVTLLKGLLNFNRRFDRVDDSGELCEEIVAWTIHDATVVARDRIPHHRTVRNKHAHGANFILAHEATVSLRVSREDGRETTFTAQCSVLALGGP
jgi:hypothetical protein